jgi:hypothetical protein
MTDKTDESRRAPARVDVHFSYLLDVDRVLDEGLDVAISASPQERQAVADFDKIPAVGRLDADFHVARRAGGRFNVSGEVRARVTQICVVSLEAFESDIVETIDVDFVLQAGTEPARPAAGPTEAIPLRLDMEDPPDPIIGGKIDLGALAGEFLTLGLDPYPRKPDAKLDLAGATGTPGDAGSPFEILKKIQKHK